MNKYLNKNTSKTVFISMACLMLTTACSGGLTNYTGVEQQNRNEVEMVRIPYSISFNADADTMDEAEIAKLNQFLMNANISYGDEFSMDFPLDREGNMSTLDNIRLMYISNLLKDSGLYLASSATPYGMEPSANTGRLLISKYIVTPPTCSWSQSVNPNHENAPISNMGCASQANLGLMVANPRDLIIGAEGGSPNAERTARAINIYQNQTVTVSSASSTEGAGN